MKTAIYIESGLTQIVLTPESKWEEDAIRQVSDQSKVRLHQGQFYPCQGGWTRHQDRTTDSSLIIVFSPPLVEP